MTKEPIPLYLAVEDDLSESVLKVILKQSSKHFCVGACFKGNGMGYLKKKIEGFNQAAKGTPFLVLTDLDQNQCAPSLMQDWLSSPRHPNLIFRVAIREVEAWVMAHRSAFAHFLGLPCSRIPNAPDTIPDAKRCLIELAKTSKKTSIRKDIVPQLSSKTGPNYNGQLSAFIYQSWSSKEARKNSPSLDKAILALEKFKPRYC